MATFYNILYNGISGGKPNFLKPPTDKEIKESIERIIQNSNILHTKQDTPSANTDKIEGNTAYIENQCRTSNQSYTWLNMTGNNNEPTQYASHQYLPDKDSTHSPHAVEQEEIEYKR